MNRFWGGGEFPYVCGVTPDGFHHWATVATPYSKRRELDTTLVGHKAKYVLASFCGDCDGAWRRRAVAEGTCRADELAAGVTLDEDDSDLILRRK